MIDVFIKSGYVTPNQGGDGERALSDLFSCKGGWFSSCLKQYNKKSFTMF